MKLKTKRIVRSIFSEDIRIILIFTVFVLSLFAGYAIMMGMLSQVGITYNTPAIDAPQRARLVDTDGDLLPDLIETTPEGQPARFNGEIIGTGTGTDPNRADTDFDGFSDGIENNFGTNPNSWFNPGFIWIVWLISLVSVIYEKTRKKDKLREYREFEEMQSGGVAADGSKFAYGGTSIFSDKKELSAEDRTKLIKSDVRFQRMIGESQPEEVEFSRNWPKLIFQFFFASIFVGFLFFVLTL